MKNATSNPVTPPAQTSQAVQATYYLKKPKAWFWKSDLYTVASLKTAVACGQVGRDWLASPNQSGKVTVGEILDSLPLTSTAEGNAAPGSVASPKSRSHSPAQRTKRWARQKAISYQLDQNRDAICDPQYYVGRSVENRRFGENSAHFTQIHTGITNQSQSTKGN